MSTEDKKRAAHRAVVVRVLEGDGTAPRDQRHAAFDNAVLGEPLRTLINKVAERPTQVTDDDIAAVKASGLTEDAIFELVVCAAVGQATRQYENALGALAEATTDKETIEHASRDPQ
jgi:alkylhydroperoxidase family enzyme